MLVKSIDIVTSYTRGPNKYITCLSAIMTMFALNSDFFDQT